MRVGIVDIHVPFMRGGGELLSEGLRRACELAGHQAEIIRLPFRFFPAADLRRCIETWKNENLYSINLQWIDKLIGLRFPAYCVPFQEKVLWLLHQHRGAYDLWDPANASEDDEAVRELIHREDSATFAEVKNIYTISRNVSARLRHYNGVDSQPLYHPPPLADRLYGARAMPFIFTVSRLETLKRLELLIEAMAHVKAPVYALIAGRGSHQERLEELVESSGVKDKVRLLGSLDEESLLGFYAHCLGVYYAPYDEDYGYVTLEAMLAAKPVITCTDSGGPLEFVRDGETGRVVEPTPEAVASAIEALWADQRQAERMGQAGLEHYHSQNISWEHVLARLLA